MKKIIIIGLLLFTFKIEAQVKIGFYSGIGVFSVNSEDLEFQNSKLGYEFGLSYDYLFTEKFEIIIDLGYSNKKPIIIGYDSDNNSKEVQLNYGGLDYSLLGSYSVYDSVIAIQAGVVGHGVFTENSDVMSDLHFKNLNNFDSPNATYGAIFGVSGNLDEFKLNLRYAKTLNNPYKDYAYYASGTPNEFDVVKANHSYINLTLVYYFLGM